MEEVRIEREEQIDGSQNIRYRMTFSDDSFMVTDVNENLRQDLKNFGIITAIEENEQEEQLQGYLIHAAIQYKSKQNQSINLEDESVEF